MAWNGCKPGPIGANHFAFGPELGSIAPGMVGQPLILPGIMDLGPIDAKSDPICPNHGQLPCDPGRLGQIPAQFRPRIPDRSGPESGLISSELGPIGRSAWIGTYSGPISPESQGFIRGRSGSIAMALGQIGSESGPIALGRWGRVATRIGANWGQ